ncbi:MAG TPA: hypothetical protein VHQ46_04395 [Desulfobacteria bacterium]|nr:hypothetical protein [Desulfobacteria bacterium]
MILVTPMMFSWWVFAIAVWVVTGVLVQGERVRSLFNIGLVGGFLLSLVINLLGVPVFHFWRFGPDILPFMGIPLALPIAWTAEVILYINYLPEHKLSIALYTAAFVAVSTIIDYFFVQFGMRAFINWNLLATFILGLISHGLILGYYYITYPEARKLAK